MRKTRKIAIFSAVVLVLAVVILLAHTTGSRAGLQRYKAELRAKGDRLTFAEFAIPPSTNPEHIACREVFATNQFTLSADTVRMLEYVAPGKVKVAWRGRLHAEPTNSDDEPNASFVFGDWSKLDSNCKSHAPELEIFRVALRNPAPDMGWNYQDTMQNLSNSWSRPRPWIAVRAVLFSLTYAAVNDLHHGNLEGAIKNLKAVTSLAQFDRNDPVPISPIMRAAVTEVGVQLTWQVLQMNGWEDTELKSLQDDWQKVDLLEGAERGFLGERAHSVIIADEIRRTSVWKVHSFFGTTTFLGIGSPSKASLRDYWDERVVPLLYKITSVNKDESMLFKQITLEVDTVRMIEANRPWPEVSAILSNRTAEFEIKLREAPFHDYFLSRLIMPRFTTAFHKFATTETERRLCVTAIAFRRYELKYRRSAPTLTALVPEFLAAVPMDPMSGKPLCYRQKSDGSYVLYSVGTDGKDDGGDATPALPTDEPGLWKGRDAVWPAAASDDEIAKEEARAGKKPE